MSSRLEKGSSSERKVMLKLKQKELLCLGNAKSSFFLIGAICAVVACNRIRRLKTQAYYGMEY